MVSEYDFIQAFLTSDTYKNNFSYDGLKALYEYLTEYEDSTGEQIEFDMIALCCDYSEYHNAKEVYEAYDNRGIVNEEEAMEWLEGNTTVIPFEGGIIIQQF